MRCTNLVTTTLAMLLLAHLTTTQEAGAGEFDGVEPSGVATDIFVPNQDQAVTVFDSRAFGNSPPKRDVSGPSTGIGLSFAAAVDRNHYEIYVSNFGDDTITVHSYFADGDATPLRTIEGPATRLSNPTGLAYDPNRRELYVRLSSSGTILVFDAWADGDVAPKRAIEGPSTQIQHTTVGIAFDPLHDELVVASRDIWEGNSAILVFPREADGDFAPIRSIRGPELTAHPPYGIFVDTKHGEYVAALPAGSIVATYPRLANGTNLHPARRIFGSATLLSLPSGVYVDHRRDELAVSDAQESGKVHYFDRTAHGNTAPNRTLEGSATELYKPGLLSGPGHLIFKDGFEAGHWHFWSSSTDPEHARR